MKLYFRGGITRQSNRKVFLFHQVFFLPLVSTSTEGPAPWRQGSLVGWVVVSAVVSGVVEVVFNTVVVAQPWLGRLVKAGCGCLA